MALSMSSVPDDTHYLTCQTKARFSKRFCNWITGHRIAGIVALLAVFSTSTADAAQTCRYKSLNDTDTGSRDVWGTVFLTDTTVTVVNESHSEVPDRSYYCRHVPDYCKMLKTGAPGEMRAEFISFRYPGLMVRTYLLPLLDLPSAGEEDITLGTSIYELFECSGDRFKTE